MKLSQQGVLQNPKTNLINDLRLYNSDLNSILTQIYKLLDQCYIYRPRYVTEADFSYSGGDFSVTSDLIGLDLSGIILDDDPRMVRLYVEVKCDAANVGLKLWSDLKDEDGTPFSSQSQNKAGLFSQVANILNAAQIDLPITSDKLLYYKLDSATWSTCSIAVQGWWL